MRGEAGVPAGVRATSQAIAGYGGQTRGRKAGLDGGGEASDGGGEVSDWGGEASDGGGVASDGCGGRSDERAMPPLPRRQRPDPQYAPRPRQIWQSLK